MIRVFAWLAVFCSLVCVGCAEDISADGDDNNNPTPSTTAGETTGVVTQQGIETTDHGDGTFTTRVDASAEDAWVLLDLDTGSAIADRSDASWDLAFQRFTIESNGGISGSGNVRVAPVVGTSFDALEKAPSDGYVQDSEDGADSDDDPDLAFFAPELWYAYNRADHTLSARDVVYVVETTDGAFFKLAFEDYYDDAGTSGFPTFRWGSIAPPDGSTSPNPTPEGSLTVDASGDWVYVSLDPQTGRAVPSDSQQWDLAFSKTQLRTNSGTSGDGLGGAKKTSEAFDAITHTSTVGFVDDSMVPLPGPPGSGEDSGNVELNEWYNYDRSTHIITPKDESYIIRTASGQYAKLQIHTFENYVFTFSLAAIDGVAETHSMDIAPADEAGAWVYIHLGSGHVVDVDSSWDLAVQRTMIQTNSGTSGEGQGGALKSEANELDAIQDVPSGEFAEDIMLPVPGPPGSGEFSGNPVLNDWYDYDPQTHSVTPKDAAYILRTADGLGFVKLNITQYASGTLSIDWAYTGPNHDAF